MKSSSPRSATPPMAVSQDVRRGTRDSADRQRRQLLRLTTKLSRTYQTIERLQARISRLLEAVQG